MHLSILQFASADVAAYLNKIETGLPRDLIARVHIRDTSAGDGDGLPRVVAELSDVTQAEVAAIEAAFANVDAPEF